MSEASPEKWAQFDEPGVITVTGFLHLPKTLPNPEAATSTSQAVPATSQREWYDVYLTPIQAQMPYKLLPVYLEQLPPPAGNNNLPYRSEPEFDLSDGPHLGYAIQWYIFALILAGGYLYFVGKQEAEASSEKTLIEN